MTGEAVKKLVEAEANISKMLEAAREEAKAIIAAAEAEGAALLAAEEENSVKSEEEILRKASADALKEKENISASAGAEREKLTALAEGRMEAAASAIAERVVNG